MSTTHRTAADTASVFTADELEGVHVLLVEALSDLDVGATDDAATLIERAVSRLGTTAGVMCETRFTVQHVDHVPGLGGYRVLDTHTGEWASELSTFSEARALGARFEGAR